MPPVPAPPAAAVAATPDLVGPKLEILAGKIADAANADGVGLSDRIDALKVLSAYYVSTRKAKLNTDDPEPEGAPDFGSFSKRIAIASSR